MKVTVKYSQGKSPDVWLKGVKQYVRRQQIPDLLTVKWRVLVALREYINSNRQRPDVAGNPATDKFQRFTPLENLYNCIEASTEIEQTSESYWKLGIGKKEFLDSHAPYWAIVNYGGKLGAGARFYGYFGKRHHRPRTNYETKEEFYRLAPGSAKKGKAWWITPTNPLPPMRYLEYMAKVFKIEMSRLKVRKKT